MTVGDVAVGEVRRGDERLIGDRHAVVRLVAIAQTLEDLDRVRDRRLLDLDRLEAPLERRVLLEVLAVLVERRGADRLQLTASEHRLEDRRSVDRAFGRTRTHERVELVDEQDDVAARADLLQHLLEALLEVTAVTRPGDERAEVERVELLALQRVGHVVDDDLLAETLDDGGLADAGLADEHRVVLGAAGQHLHDPLDLTVTPDDRIELLLPSELGEVASELVEHQRAALGGLTLAARARTARRLLAPGRTLVARQELDHLLAHSGQIRAQLHEHLRGHALALTDEAEEDVLGADVVVTELQCLTQRQLEDLLRAGRERDVPRRRLAALTDDLLDLAADSLEGDAERLECLRGNAFALVDEAEEDVLGADVVVVQEACFLLCQDDDSAGSVCEALEQGNRLSGSGETYAESIGGAVEDTAGRFAQCLFFVGRNRLGWRVAG